MASLSLSFGCRFIVSDLNDIWENFSRKENWIVASDSMTTWWGEITDVTLNWIKAVKKKLRKMENCIKIKEVTRKFTTPQKMVNSNFLIFFSEASLSPQCMEVNTFSAELYFTLLHANFSTLQHNRKKDTICIWNWDHK